jgi:hypothetical protein
MLQWRAHLEKMEDTRHPKRASYYKHTIEGTLEDQEKMV